MFKLGYRVLYCYRQKQH